MSDGLTLTLGDIASRRKAHEAVHDCPDGWVCTIKPPTRSLAQNARMWTMLGDLSVNHRWHGQKLSPEEWKDFFTAALKGQRVVPGMDSGFVVLGTRTRSMTIAEMGDLMTLMEAFAAREGFRFKAWEYEAA